MFVCIYPQTPLHLAAEKGYARCLQILIYHGADIMAKNSQHIRAQDMIRGIEACERVFQDAMSKQKQIVIGKQWDNRVFALTCACTDMR